VLTVTACITLQAHAAPPFKARATLSAFDAPMKGKAKFEQKGNDQGPYRLDVHVNRALPLQTLDVMIDGVVVGQIVTNPGGSGRLRINNIATAINPGAIISVGISTGVFETHGHDGSS
jgi:hypothetical protein